MTHDITHLGLLEDAEIVLDAAALEIALLDHEGADPEPYTDLLADLAERLAREGALAATAHDRADALGHVLAGEFGFAGDREDYDHPANADLIRVIDRRRGLPVSLTVLYVAAARRVGWEAEALNTPGHVLARIGGGTDPVLVDPFNGGAVIGAEGVQSILSGVFGHPVTPTAEHLAAMSNRAVLVRLLLNPARRAERGGELARALELYVRMTLVAPEQPHPWWERARLEVAHGRAGAARSSLSAMLEITRDPNLRIHICAALEALARLDG